MATFLEALQSENRQVRWDRIVWEAFNLASHKDKHTDESAVPFLIKELKTDYSAYLADAQGEADDDFYHPNRLFAAVLVILARLGPKAEPGLEALLNFVWDTRCDTVQTPWEEAWQVEGGYTYVKISELLDGTLFKIGPQIIPNLIQALGWGEPAATRSAATIKKWGSEAVPELLKAADDPDMVVRHRAGALLAKFRARARIEKPSRLKDDFSRVYARLRILIDQDDLKTKERLRTLLGFVEHGSFRKVAAAEAERSGYESDHSGPASRLRRLGESLGVPLTRTYEGKGVKRAELTEEGRALAEWLALNSWAVD